MPKKYRDKDEILRDIKLEKALKEMVEYSKQAEINQREIKSINDSIAQINDIESYNGLRVKINYKRFDKRIKDGKLTTRFILWLDSNKEREFIAKEYTPMIYTLDNEDWLFEHYDLIFIK